ncbi:hypothetical protein [Labedaea rhizosphaerae]|uniref:Lactococcin 972 family bacteriocin n=1 Tax=Labedaea rhizosphaerae TaxID=598644 RepID=A0A4R6SJG3_LABRH|nr:hypothetical protein [Labedaea rhizosphaerae]TDQ04198.1 hypothetical protein EV186_101140 [Labedaea rhizosphaerae]
MKKALFVAASVAGLSLIAAPAFASPASTNYDNTPCYVSPVGPTETEAGNCWNEGGAELGGGAAKLVSSAWFSVWGGPAWIAGTFTH